MPAIDFAIQTSERTKERLVTAKNWIRHVRKPSAVRVIGDEEVGEVTYSSAIAKTLHALDTFKADFDWIYIVDDDGYVAVRRLEKFLSDFNPDENFAIGCCHGKLVHDSSKFPAMHGGPGMALSRATACHLQQLHWHGEIVRHWRHSDGTISINLHRIGITPMHSDLWEMELPKDDHFIACHRVLPDTPKEIVERLNKSQTTPL